jgi:NAD(P)-dependent dehydrogenase (short-subunit alcohol dehydrogenase family)
MRLENKVIIVVGASGGIGSVLSREFHREGANVVLAARTKEKLLVLQRSLPAPEKTLVVPTDASNPADVTDLFRSAKEKYGRIDAVVISVGTWARLSIDDSVREAEDLLSAHFRGIFQPTFFVGFVAQQFFRKQGYGLIVNISSHAAIRPELKGNLSYGPMKGAAWHFLRGLMNEIKEPAVRIVDLKPAIVNTPDNAGLLNTPEKKAEAVQPETIAKWIMEHFDDPDDQLPTSVEFSSRLELD